MALDWISVDSIFLDPVVPVILCIKYDVEVSPIIIFIRPVGQAVTPSHLEQEV